MFGGTRVITGTASRSVASESAASESAASESANPSDSELPEDLNGSKETPGLQSSTVSGALSKDLSTRTLSDLSNDELHLLYSESQDDAVRNLLIERYLPNVEKIARKFKKRLPNSVDLEEMVQAGIFGLIDALSRFDVNRGIKFTTYFPRRVHGAMLDELRGQDWVPRLVRSNGAKIEKARQKLESELGHAPTEGELASHFGKTVEEFQAWESAETVTTVRSLDFAVYETDSLKEVTNEDYLGDEAVPDPSDRLSAHTDLASITRGMNKIERLIWISYHHLGETMKEIGKSFDLSESRVSQMHSDMIERLVRRFAPEKLQSFSVAEVLASGNQEALKETLPADVYRYLTAPEERRAMSFNFGQDEETLQREREFLNAPEDPVGASDEFSEAVVANSRPGEEVARSTTVESESDNTDNSNANFQSIMSAIKEAPKSLFKYE